MEYLIMNAITLLVWIQLEQAFATKILIVLLHQYNKHKYSCVTRSNDDTNNNEFTRRPGLLCADND